MKLSKSKYVLGTRCEKLLWLSCYKKEEQEENRDVILESGNKVGELARQIFGDNYILIEYSDNQKLMIDETSKYLKEKSNVICEASFSYDDNFCSIDILKNDIDGVEIYEVKSSTEINTSYINDISYQTWVLKKCGLNVKKSYLVYVNNKYVYHKKLNLNEYFTIKDVTNLLNVDEIDKNTLVLKKIINSNNEPDIRLSKNCKKNKDTSYDCPFFKYCTRSLPKPNVFDLGWRTLFSKKLELYEQGKIAFKDAIAANLNENTIDQINFELNDLKPKINKENIKKLLDSFTYPLYFLDFESFQEAIPRIDGTKPYQQICFQYSLHYLDENGCLHHKEYLSDDYFGNPMYGLCKELCRDIPLNSCVLVYNQSFEITRLKEMASLFPEFKNHLLNIVSNIRDLLPPFQNHDYYAKEMGGSASIKKVLPALFPNDPKLDYHNLEQVHKGDEASSAYLSLKDLSNEEQIILRKNMLKYCELDTYAMVKIYEKLKEMIA